MLKSRGKLTLLCEHKNKYRPIEFEILDNVTNVLGLKTCEEMRLVKRIETDTLSKYAYWFGLHHRYCPPHSNRPRTRACPPRKVPVTIRSKVKEELQRMERVHEPTD